ncbi:tetratricopeptide repeat domain containing protein [Colletotrichum sojae]|uniref:Tetratricopeptide repeat domain containing protein n=1 Tax=Colletotrichum sojae TaxID=2175907 RepID=A0A8H6MTP0_9PEZI|nr:tetratricopeptide repeat domain containing protein [Colletotrichum sojae]
MEVDRRLWSESLPANPPDCIWCLSNPDDRHGPCLTCTKVNRDSPKVIHKQICYRVKITDVAIFLPHDLGITDRKLLSTEDITHRTNEGPIEVQIMTRRLCSEPLTVRVQRFFSQSGDKINYWWTNDERGGAVDQTTLPPYALASLRETTGQLDEYMTKHAIKSWKEQIDRGDLHPVIADHFCFALRHYYQLDEEHKDRQLLHDLFTWRFALHHSMEPSWVYHRAGSSYKCLDKFKVKEEDHPLFHRIPTPRMVVAQMHSINCERFIEPRSKALLRDLEKLYSKSVSKSFFTIYIVTFFLLYELGAMIEQQRTGRGRFSGMQKEPGRDAKYADYLRTMRANAETLLLHWQYYKRPPHKQIKEDGFYGDAVNKGFVYDISDDQSAFYRKTSFHLEKMHAEEAKVNPKAYGSSFYWVSRMFVADWVPEMNLTPSSAGKTQASETSSSSPGTHEDCEDQEDSIVVDVEGTMES